jgi:hypothetical protein
VHKRLTFTSSPARSGSERASFDLARGSQRLGVVELLRALTLYQKIAVVESLEINFDHVGTGVIDPHVDERMGNV